MPIFRVQSNHCKFLPSNEYCVSKNKFYMQRLRCFIYKFLLRKDTKHLFKGKNSPLTTQKFSPKYVYIFFLTV